MSAEVSQHTVADWFDGIYGRKGAAYLRPVSAYHVFLTLLGARPEQRLLDVACGPGVLLRAASGYARELHGVDISRVAVGQARRAVPRASIVLGNAERLPYRGGAFDLVTCLGSLERMLDVGKVLTEMRRVGTRQARYCFLVRNSATLTWRWLAPFTARQRALAHAGADTLDNWTRLFEAHGFVVRRVLPDQYPLQLRRRWTLRPVDYRRPIESGRLERANEFVFVLEAAP